VEEVLEAMVSRVFVRLAQQKTVLPLNTATGTIAKPRIQGRRRVDPAIGERGDWLSVAVEERTLKIEIPEKGDQ
jgi:hypothetical protein